MFTFTTLHAFGGTMHRRKFVALLGCGAAWPIAAHGQPTTLATIGYLNTGAPDQSARLLRAFQEGLKDAGFVEGQNVLIEFRWAHDDRDRLRPMAAELVSRNVNVIAATGGSPAPLAAKAQTQSIPTVFAIGVDPVRIGLVSSLSRPGANITGATMLAVDLGSKRLELLCQVVPDAKTIGALINPRGAGSQILLRDLETSSKALGRQIHTISVTGQAEFEPALTRLAQQGARALVIGADPLFNSHSEELAALSLRHRMPAIYQFHEFTSSGGLMSYGGAISDTYRQAGFYTGRVLKGETPAELPVQQVAKVELIINLKTAKTLGLTIPLPLLGRADEVIE